VPRRTECGIASAIEQRAASAHINNFSGGNPKLLGKVSRRRPGLRRRDTCLDWTELFRQTVAFHAVFLTPIPRAPRLSMSFRQKHLVK
jgi:hypothetical protein